MRGMTIEGRAAKTLIQLFILILQVVSCMLLSRADQIGALGFGALGVLYTFAGPSERGGGRRFRAVDVAFILAYATIAVGVFL